MRACARTPRVCVRNGAGATLPPRAAARSRTAMWFLNLVDCRSFATERTVPAPAGASAAAAACTISAPVDEHTHT
jgi:hypothetical protein